jgi:hypothetical protein
MHPGLSRPPACREGPGRVLAAPAVRSSQAQVHVTNFDYNHHPLNTTPGIRPASRPRATARDRSAQPRQQVTMDDNLIIWFTKDLVS